MPKTVPFCHIGQSRIRPLRGSLSAIFLLLMVAIILGCSGQPEEVDIFDEPRFEGWKVYNYENFRILYAPGHPQEPGFEQLAAGYVRALVGVSQMLDIEVPEDTVRIIFYTGWGQGREMTGRQVPFVEDEVIHFWLPSHLGVTFMHWMLPKWVDRDPAHEFLWHGLVSLFDYSGYNYHKMTLGYVDDGRFIKLADLAVDTTIDSNTERLQSAEAASFCAFILAWYGPDRLKTLYTSDIEFNQLVQDSLYITTDSLQTLWLNVIEANQPADSTEVDTTG